ncbi:MAG: sugar ABC transporter ATP-binding protein [Actinobacteria bacterium]|nr:sugar ABC transporter ATP-binding protein [Actinomycetota bacterium]
MSEPAVLTVRNLSKRFGHLTALNGVDLEVRRGEIHALVGENGSGKSTLVKALAGYHRIDGGEARIDGELVDIADARATESRGIRFVHQDLALVDELDSVSNLGLGEGARTSGIFMPIRRRRESDRVRAALATLGYQFSDLGAPVAELSASQRTALAIARAMSAHRSAPKVMILDEPTASLPAAEVDRLFALLRSLRDTGVAILIISHHFNEVFDISDRVTVLRDGEVVGVHNTRDITEEELVKAMLGRKLNPRPSRTRASLGPVMLAASALSGDMLKDLHFEVHAGEILGIAGITGSGREELAGLMFGDMTRAGSISLGGREVPPGRPDLAKTVGMSYLPADRHNNAVLPGLSVRENVSITNLSRYLVGGILRKGVESKHVSSLLRALDVRPIDGEVDIETLSGGNQQKVMLARLLITRPRILLLDEPTQGVDIGAREEIYNKIEDLAASGLCIVLCSCESEELARLADRILVMSGGRCVETLTGPLSVDDITLATMKRRVAA